MPARIAIAVAVACALTACSSASGRSPSIDSPDGGTETVDSPLTSSPKLAAITADPIAAAVTYVASTDELMAHSPIGRREIFRKLLTPSALTGQVPAFEEAATALAATLDVPVERLVWVEAPLTATLVAATDVKASVDVWTVSILGAPDAGSPQQVWRTVHVDLELLDGRWLIARATADSGPTPATNELAMQSGWNDFATVAAWPAVVEGADL